jgi:hypothetical protein
MAELADGVRVVVSQRACQVVVRAQAQVAQMLPLVCRVMAQTRAPILGGDKHYHDKVMSLFEPHTEAIRQGQGFQAHRVWQAGEDPGGRKLVRGGLPSLPAAA